MEQSSSYDEQKICHQFDRVCQMALKGEVASYYKHIEYRRKHEVTFSDLPEKALDSFYVMDEYEVEYHRFQIHGYDIEVKDALIAEALQSLTERKREVILLSYFLDMNDVEIARELHLVQSTIHEHRKRSLELLKEIMERSKDGKKK